MMITAIDVVSAIIIPSSVPVSKYMTSPYRFDRNLPYGDMVCVGFRWLFCLAILVDRKQAIACLPSLIKKNTGVGCVPTPV